ncbi:MAG: ABC transporter ATP-binding protein [Sedimentisphaerales bacterium]|nr:ABC transporter ATP-binding protein [Sedimentisphaerales bacterium]
MSEFVINTKNLTRDYGENRALDNVNLEIEKGRVVALLGPNGAGKTTFLRLLMGLIEPTEGESFILRSPSRNMAESVVSKIGYMGDTDEPPRWSTIRDLMKLQAAVSGDFDRDFFMRSVEKRELSVKRSYGSLSKGQKKWIRAGLVLAGKPAVLLLDEPAEGLDPSARQDLYDELRDYVTDKEATAIVATHIISDIERIADDAAVIDHGRLITYAELEDLREQVREIQMSEMEKVIDFPNEIEILGGKSSGGTKLLWVRCREQERQKLEKLLGQKATIRTVSLETFYLALTEHNSNKRDAELKEIKK